MKKRQYMAGVAVCLAVAIGLVGCQPGTADTQETEQELSVVVGAQVPGKGSLAVSSTFVGTVSPQEQVNIIPLVSGEVAEANYEVGDYVEAGSVLVMIDDEAARLQLESAELTMEGAQLSARRTLGSSQEMSNLSMENSISGIQYQIDIARKQYEAAADSVADAGENREDMQKALDQINESINGMQNSYSGMKSMAASAKNCVEQDAGGTWRWIQEPDWESEYITSPESVPTAPEDSPSGPVENPDDPEEDTAESEEDTTDSGQDTAETEEDPSVLGEGTDGTGDGRKSYAQYQKDYAEYKAKEALIGQLKATGYSPADIGEGRMDSQVAEYASRIASLRSQASSLESSIKSMDSSIASAESSRESTQNTIDYYEDNLKNAQTQYGIQNGQAYEDTKAALDNQIAASRIGVESARMQLDNYVLTTPISGVIEQKNVDKYGMVSAGNPVYVISNKDSMTVTFTVSEAVNNTLTVGQEVTLERNGQTWQAHITQVGQSADARTGLFTVKAAVEGSSLASGVTVKITADTRRTDNALLLPYDAVYFENEKAYVYCVENGTAVKTEVVTGIYSEDTIEITDGLTEESMVISTWSSQLYDGAKVRIVQEEKE